MSELEITPTIISTAIFAAFVGSIVMTAFSFWLSRSYGAPENRPVGAIGLAGVGVAMLMSLGWTLLVGVPMWAILLGFAVVVSLFVAGMRVERAKKKDDYFHVGALVAGWVISPVLATVPFLIDKAIELSQMTITVGMVLIPILLVAVVVGLIKLANRQKSHQQEEPQEAQAATT